MGAAVRRIRIQAELVTSFSSRQCYDALPALPEVSFLIWSRNVTNFDGAYLWSELEVAALLANATFYERHSVLGPST